MYACNFKALDQDVICGNMSYIKNGSWSKEMRGLRIRPTDTGDNDQNSKPIQVLIGADRR